MLLFFPNPVCVAHERQTVSFFAFSLRNPALCGPRSRTPDITTAHVQSNNNNPSACSVCLPQPQRGPTTPFRRRLEEPADGLSGLPKPVKLPAGKAAVHGCGNACHMQTRHLRQSLSMARRHADHVSFPTASSGAPATNCMLLPL
jgi:hypothetical protein